MDQSLPPHLAERVRWVVPPGETPHGPGEFVLYWMHNAVRGHENPALDVAICLARQNGLPLLVYHGLSERYPFASDRHHTFILQGARDVQRELAERGIRYAFHLQMNGDRGPHLRDLTRRAAVLVNEEMPVPPLTDWVERLTAITTTPIVHVDTACVVPVPLVDRSYNRAFQYREATAALYESRIGAAYPDQTVDCELYAGPLPFTSLDLQSECLGSLIGRCRVDHSVAPVADSPGGTRAGYARWEAFKRDGLADYRKRRNDATEHSAVSRLSPYLHYGMVSPFRIAREAHEAGAEKFLDELLVWREMSFHFCYHNSDNLETLDALPDWARETLVAHADDPRESDHSWETLARARVGDPLWDACQRSLIKHGELHNNVRMTWGKALLPWAASPGRALHLCIDLNHRFALDGRDPNSYGGILWCFGQFDRPFSPESDIYGRVRQRPIESHLKRIDLNRFSRIVDRPIAATPPTVGVVGAGLAGLTAARNLADHGLQVQVFEKSRGVGGRIASRRVGDEITFDHGAQYFTARDRRFTKHVQSWIHDGWVEPWMGRIVELAPGGTVSREKSGTPRYVGKPTMNAIAKHLASDLNIHRQTTVQRLERTADERWRLRDNHDQPLGTFDVVIVNCPAPQAARLLEGTGSEIQASAESVTLRPCWALMLQSDQLSPLDFDGAFINEGILSWIAHDGRKPGRRESGGPTWVAHASPPWSEDHLEADEPDVRRQMIEAFQWSAGIEIGRPRFAAAHRWRYSSPSQPLDEECLWDPVMGLGACGDWCGGPRIEGAFLSGDAMAGAVLRHMTIDRAPPKAVSAANQPTLF